MYRRNSNMVIGLIFIVLGALFLLKNTGIIDIYFNIFDILFIFAKFWPLIFLIIPGIAIHSIFFSGKSRDAGILVPGGILLIAGITSQISMLFGWWSIMWPGFILAVAVGLFELYLFGSREKALLIPVGILTLVAMIFLDRFTIGWLFGFHLRQYFVPVVLILFGILVIFKNNSHKDDF